MITYARSRLWVGILSVGSWVLISLFILLNINKIPVVLRNLSPTLSILTFLGFYITISIPFDFVGGFILPNRYGKIRQNFIQYILSYFRGVAFHGIFLFLISLFFLFLLTSFPLTELLIPLLTSVLLIQLVLSVNQGYIARLIGKFTISKSTNFSDAYEVWETKDIRFTGGISLFGNQSILPKKWIESFSTDDIKLLLKRRAFLKEKWSHLFGIVGAILFNLTGVFIGYLGLVYTDITFEDNSYLSFLLVWSSSVSLWSFFGLLFLPTLSQKATLFGDSIWRQEDNNKISQLIRNLDELQDLEPKRQPQIQRIFHPIASVKMRIDALEKSQYQSITPWHIARYTLFYSWSMLSFMGRAVHCNVGCPHLWVFLPSDG